MLRSCLRNRSVVPGLGPRDRHLTGATELGSLILALMLKGRVPTEEYLSTGSRGLSQRPTCNNFHLIGGGVAPRTSNLHKPPLVGWIQSPLRRLHRAEPSFGAIWPPPKHKMHLYYPGAPPCRM